MPALLLAAFAAFDDLDKTRFNSWFEHDARLPELAAELNTNVLELAQWASQPHIAEALDAIATIARQRHATLRAEAQHAATARLLRIARFCDNDETARRAADRLLRSLPTGERPLDDEPHHKQTQPSDKDVHGKQPTPQVQLQLKPLAPLQPLRPASPLATIDDAAPSDTLRAPTPTPPPVPPLAGKLSSTLSEQIAPIDPARRSHEALVAAVIAATQRLNLDLDDPDAFDDLVEELNIDDDDLDDLQDAIDDAQLDLGAADFEQTHGVPITHPAIRAAIADLRLDDLPAIAATIRNTAPS